MYITKIENFGKSKIKVYIDEEYRFWLYNRELKKHPIKEDTEISEADFEELYKLNLIRSKKQILNLLKRMDKTRQEVIKKLEQAGYPEDIISDTLAYIDSYNYLDDERYARQFVRYKRTSKSKREIENQLLIKGVSKDIITGAILEEYGSEDKAIQKAIKKKAKGNQELTKEKNTKLAAYLYSKGFNFDLIKKHLDIY